MTDTSINDEKPFGSISGGFFIALTIGVQWYIISI